MFLQYLSVDGKLGNETYIDVLPESSSQCPPNFTLIGFFFLNGFVLFFGWKS